MKVSELGEFGLIDLLAKMVNSSRNSQIAAWQQLLIGIGDDAAVIRGERKHCLLLTTDTLVEGIHFERSSISSYLLGKKCLSVNLSDIAAMGGTPLYYIVSLSVPPSTPVQFIKKIYQGILGHASHSRNIT